MLANTSIARDRNSVFSLIVQNFQRSNSKFQQDKTTQQNVQHSRLSSSWIYNNFCIPIYYICVNIHILSLVYTDKSNCIFSLSEYIYKQWYRSDKILKNIHETIKRVALDVWREGSGMTVQSGMAPTPWSSGARQPGRWGTCKITSYCPSPKIIINEDQKEQK